MQRFDKYDEIDYTGKSDPDIWETHIEFYYSKTAAFRRHKEIKARHPEAAKKAEFEPFFRPVAEVEIHQDLIKDKGSKSAKNAQGLWQVEYWLPSTEKQAATYETRMSDKDVEGWKEHRRQPRRNTRVGV